MLKFVFIYTIFFATFLSCQARSVVVCSLSLSIHGAVHIYDVGFTIGAKRSIH